jgi:hypothetical protein
MVFNATYFFIAVFFNVLWRYASSTERGLLAPDVDMASVERISHQYAFGPMLYLVCLGLASVSVPTSPLMNITLACFFALPPTWGRNPGK